MNKCTFENKLLNKRESAYISLIPYIIVLALFIAILFFNSTYQRIYVVGQSMEDTLYGAPDSKPSNIGGDFVYIFDAKPQRGDIVVVRKDDKAIIKRVIAIGGDKVEVKSGKVYLNDKQLVEPYVSEDNNNNWSLLKTCSVTVEQGEIFVLGDNRDNSWDSRDYGCLPESDLIGVVAEWSLTCKGVVTAINTFFEFTLPSWFGVK